jgi:carbamoyltransferase
LVCRPVEAFRCFMRTEMDYLVLGNYLLDKTKQTVTEDDKKWMKEFQLD